MEERVEKQAFFPIEVKTSLGSHSVNISSVVAKTSSTVSSSAFVPLRLAALREPRRPRTQFACGARAPIIPSEPKFRRYVPGTQVAASDAREVHDQTLGATQAFRLLRGKADGTCKRRARSSHGKGSLGV